jgi:Protein of unknown function (DUF3421)
MKKIPIFVLFTMVLITTSTSVQALVGGKWVQAPGNGVVVGSPGGRHSSLIVCRANYDNGQHPGKVWDGTCNFGWGGRTIYGANYEVLVDNHYRWVTASTDGLPPNAVDGGDAGNAAGHVRLGVCEVFNGGDGSWHPGKFYANKCNYAWGGSKTNNLGQELAQSPNGNVHILVGN